ncbi:zinc-binding dehydrogenase [Xylariales sp. PMI_506]|nr:zinc-binding dehydrogenase [Xylariales sp. PMI_506]
MLENSAAYLTGAKTYPLSVQSAPYTTPGPDQIVIQNAAVALNPVDAIKQNIGNFIYSWIKYPFVLGMDVAGTVVDIGSNVRRFKVGERVLGHATGAEEKHNTSAMSGFQLYTVLQEKMASEIPQSLDFEKAAVLPLGVSTASCALFMKDQLRLPHPSAGCTPVEKSQVKDLLIVWGGSTSVGCNAIQLATAAGCEVITTCSPQNFELVKSLGAKAAFDYRSPTVTEDIVRACQGRKVAGAVSIGNSSAKKCVDILGRSEGNRFLSMVSYPNPANPRASIPARVWTFVSFAVWLWFRKRATGVRAEFVWGAALEDNDVATAVYEKYLPKALERGEYTCAPEPEIIGSGLDAIQSGLDILTDGKISAKKLVIKF